jgi:hypothetical protein
MTSEATDLAGVTRSMIAFGQLGGTVKFVSGSFAIAASARIAGSRGLGGRSDCELDQVHALIPSVPPDAGALGIPICSPI